jgi:hypothetical protein
MPHYTCDDEQAGDNVNYHPEGLQEQSYAGFTQRQDRYIRAIVIGLAHHVPCCSSPDTL